MAPTRELANQVYSEVKALSGEDVSSFCIYGGVSVQASGVSHCSRTGCGGRDTWKDTGPHEQRNSRPKQTQVRPTTCKKQLIHVHLIVNTMT